MKQQVIIVGAGASGLAAAIQAARQGASVTVLEHTARPGKKLLSTGNGKCNLTNLMTPDGAYRGGQPVFIKKGAGPRYGRADSGIFPGPWPCAYGQERICLSRHRTGCLCTGGPSF
uniref:FAD-dependent oxidoreductase n=1 Tax=Clostridium sp. NkU-1 TaxID=1095009 RepID=UPI0032603596